MADSDIAASSYQLNGFPSESMRHLTLVTEERKLSNIFLHCDRHKVETSRNYHRQKKGPQMSEYCLQQHRGKNVMNCEDKHVYYRANKE